MKIMYIPLDERPCNYKYPINNSNENIHMLIPPTALMPNKEKPADTGSASLLAEPAIENRNGTVGG